MTAEQPTPEQPTTEEDSTPIEDDTTSTPDEPTDDATAESNGEPSSNAEAAKYRRRLRTAEAERDELATRLAASQAREIDTLASAALVRPDDFRLVHPDASGLLDDAGNIDTAAVTNALEQLLAERPYLSAPRAPRPDPNQGRDPGNGAGVGWGQVFSQGGTK